MSLLMFRHDEDGFVIMTDTLATTPEGRPLLFQNKCWALPHLKMVIGGTGLGNFISQWYYLVQTGMLVRDATMLDIHTPETLRTLWRGLQEDARLPLPTATIYHFGVDAESKSFVRYTYRSERDFESELCAEPGFGIKPAPNDLAMLEVPTTLEEMVRLAEVVRGQQDAQGISSRVHIGGELLLTTITGDGLVSTCPVHRFADYEEMWGLMTSQTEGEGL